MPSVPKAFQPLSAQAEASPGYPGDERWDFLGSDATLWRKRPHVAEVYIVFKSCRTDSYEQNILGIPKLHDAKWFNLVHCGLLGNWPVSLTHSPENGRHGQESPQGRLYSWAWAKDELFFPWRTGFLVFDVVFINPVGPVSVNASSSNPPCWCLQQLQTSVSFSCFLMLGPFLPVGRQLRNTFDVTGRVVPSWWRTS